MAAGAKRRRTSHVSYQESSGSEFEVGSSDLDEFLEPVESTSGNDPLLKTQSPAEFFAKNQNIAGFDNSGKSLYTTIREFVENALDAAETAHVLPDVAMNIERLSSSEFHMLRGIMAEDQSQPDPESSFAESMDMGQSIDPTEESVDQPKVPSKPGDGFFRITCIDNGVGMAHEDIPQLLGVVLTSTKLGLKQSRGKFGLGAKMALVWSKKSTGLPIEVESCQGPSREISMYKLDIDVQRNRPTILHEERRPNPDGWRGTKISVVIRGRWTSYRAKIISYLRQLAIITPYAQFTLAFQDWISKQKSFTLQFSRRTDKLPTLPKLVKYHPSAVDNLLVESLLALSPHKQLDQFLSREFSNVSAKLAKQLIASLGSGFRPSMSIRTLSKGQIHQLTQMLRQYRFDKPSGACLSPAGEYNLRLGIFKEVQPDMVSTYSAPAAVFEGHPFIVEAGVSLGGANARQGITVYRFANRIPLLYEGSNDVINKVANLKIRWANYKIKSKIDKIGVFVSIVSTRIPFKGTSKEYIGDDKQGGVIHETVKTAILECCKQLKRKLATKASQKVQDDRKKNLTRYIPDVCRSLYGVLQTIDPEAHGMHCRPLLRDMRSGQVSEAVLAKSLQSYVNKIDQEAAIEFVTSTGKQMRKHRDKVYLAPFDAAGTDRRVSSNGCSIFIRSFKPE